MVYPKWVRTDHDASLVFTIRVRIEISKCVSGNTWTPIKRIIPSACLIVQLNLGKLIRFFGKAWEQHTNGSICVGFCRSVGEGKARGYLKRVGSDRIIFARVGVWPTNDQIGIDGNLHVRMHVFNHLSSCDQKISHASHCVDNNIITDDYATLNKLGVDSKVSHSPEVEVLKRCARSPTQFNQCIAMNRRMSDVFDIAYRISITWVCTELVTGTGLSVPLTKLLIC